jgi:hypothetical protein
MKRHLIFHVLIALLVMAAGTSMLRAEWLEDGAAVCREGYDQIDCDAVSDGAGGSIIVWRDNRAGSLAKVYAQRMDALGDPIWTAGGIEVCSYSSNQTYPAAASDGSGGVIVAWADDRNSYTDIYAQRIDPDGNLLWSASGVAICNALYSQDMLDIEPDGSGGALITWRDIRNNYDYDIFAQKINSSGVVQWMVDGVTCCAGSGNEQGPRIVTDGSGGAVVTWYDSRSGTNDIYAQRVGSGGSVQWTTNGVAVCTATNHQQNPEMIAADAGCVIIAWNDYRPGTNSDVYAQKLDASGTKLWSPSDGIAVCNDSEDQQTPRLV